MGADDRCVTDPIAPASASDLGDRLILTRTETSRAVTYADVQAMAADLASGQNVVVIVPSRRRSNEWAHLSTDT